MEILHFLTHPSIVTDRVKQLQLRANFRGIYRKYRDRTIVHEAKYVRNLELVHEFRNVRGCVVECGVWRAGMTAGIADVLGDDRDYFLFDSFEGLPPAREIDGALALAWQSNPNSQSYHNNNTASEQEASDTMKRSRAKSVTLVKGWFKDTVPGFKPPSDIAVLRLDGDWYDSTRVCLEHLVPFVADHGVVIIDDYYAFDGCTRAVNEFLSRAGSPSEVMRFRQFRDQVAYFIKGDVRVPPQAKNGTSGLDADRQRGGAQR